MFFQQAAPKISFEEAKLRREEVKANFRTFIKICAAMMAGNFQKDFNQFYFKNLYNYF